MSTKSAAPSAGTADASPLRLPPNALAQQMKNFKAQPVLYAVGATCAPLLACIAVVVTLLHSALACALMDAGLAWGRFLLYRVWHSQGAKHTHDKTAHHLSNFQVPLLLALITLRLLVQRAVAQHVPHTSMKKRKVVTALAAGYAAIVWVAFHGAARDASATGDAAHASSDVTPSKLFLSLYHSTLFLSLLSVVSSFWVPSSDSALRESEHALLRAHVASSGSDAQNLDQQLRQHHAGNIAYTVLQAERDQLDAGSGQTDWENEGARTPKEGSYAKVAKELLTHDEHCNAALPVRSMVPTPMDAKHPNRSFTGTAVVFLHGYGAGKSFWFLNLPAISAGIVSSGANARVYSLDLPGMGSSAHQYTMSHCSNARQAEDYFVHALEEWRAALRLERLVLVGHSFGGLVAASYALRHPVRVELLVLVSPVGLPVPPPLDPLNPAAAPSRAPAWMKKYGLVKLVQWLWRQNVTPSQVLHWFGPAGPYLFRSIVSRRFAYLDAASAKTRKDGSVSPAGLHVRPLCDYLYHLNAGPCPGHKGLNLLLRPGAFAVDPLLPRLVAGLSAPTVFFYGEDDWMSVAAGREVAAAVAKKKVRGEDGPHVHAEVVTVPSAGHQLALENPKFFNKQMVRVVLEHIQRLAKEREEDDNVSTTDIKRAKDAVATTMNAAAVDDKAVKAVDEAVLKSRKSTSNGATK